MAKSGRLSISLDYLRFTIEADGEEFTEELSEVLESILEKDRTCDSVVADYIRENGLGSDFNASDDEMSRYPGTRCLVNYFCIKDRPLLRKIDKRISTYRTAELLATPLDMPFTFDYLKALHAHLFGDLYPSAGIVRKSITGKHTEYCRADYLEPQAAKLFTALRKDNYLKGHDEDDIEDFINAMAYYMGEMEALHPFLDGNGRVTRLFFSELALDAGFAIGWSSADPDNFLEANVAALDGDYQALVDVLEEIVIPVSKKS